MVKNAKGGRAVTRPRKGRAVVLGTANDRAAPGGVVEALEQSRAPYTLLSYQ